MIAPGSGGMTVLETPGFLPDAVRDIATACFAQHEICQAETRVDWAYLSPPSQLIPRERTGAYRLGADELLVDAEGVSAISMEEYAVVLLDEAEAPKNYRTRFTAAY